MQNIKEILENFVTQAREGDLKKSHYPKEYNGFNMKVSFGMGAPAKIPWIGFRSDDSSIGQGGINPVYLYYKDLGVMILAYGVSETSESPEMWPTEIINNVETIESYFDQKVFRYGDSFVFKAYKVDLDKEVKFIYDKTDKEAGNIDLDSDLKIILDYYSKVIGAPTKEVQTHRSQGIFYMEKQLEDFIIHNWESTELGKKYDLLIEDGELLSQQFRTEIGPIDILAKDKNDGGYVVIELKKDQTSDDTVGQVARYMGWVKKNMKAASVKGVIIAAKYDKKLDYALEVVNDVDVFLYEVNFKLNQFKD